MLRMKPSQRGVQGHFADGNAHSARALVAQSQNAFAIADHDAFHAVVPGMAEDLRNALLVRMAEENSSGLSPNLAEALAPFANGRRVDQRQHFFDVAHQQS